MKKILFSKYAIIGLFALTILLCLTFLEFKLFTDYKEKLNYYYLAKYMSKKTSEEITTFEPEQEIEPSNEKSEKILKLEELHAQNEDVVAWIEIPRN